MRPCLIPLEAYTGQWCFLPLIRGSLRSGGRAALGLHGNTSGEALPNPASSLHSPYMPTSSSLCAWFRGSVVPLLYSFGY